MSQTWDGCEPSKPTLRLEGKSVIVQKIPTYEYDEITDSSFSYVKEVIYHFSDEEKAKEYYYKKK